MINAREMKKILRDNGYEFLRSKGSHFIYSNGIYTVAVNKDLNAKAFYDLWEFLREKKLVTHTIEQLENSELFKYSPYKKLSDEQRKVVTMIMQSLRINNEQRIIINGMPGSGKTVVAVYLFKLLRESKEFKELKIGFVVPQTSLRDTMKKLFRNLHGLSAKDVLGPNEVVQKKYDILIVDEAHRLKKRKNLSSYAMYDKCCESIGMSNEATQLDWILHQSKCAILCFDQKQIVGPSNISMDMLNKEFVNSGIMRMCTYYSLVSQMRCNGGNDYLQYIQDILNNKKIEKTYFYNYELKIVSDFNQYEKLFREKERDYGLTRMVAGYAWKWESKKNTEKYDIVIDNVRKRWNSTLANWIYSDCACNEVGCIHSVQGYDLNYGFVILGNDIKYDKSKKQIVVDESSYYDRYGKIGADEETLTEYIKNIYYVLMTRGIRGTFLYVCNRELREYLKQYVDEL